MTWAELDVLAAEPTLDEDQLASVVPFDGMTDELQRVSDHKGDRCPGGWVAPNEKMDWQYKRDRQADQMERHVAGMQMAFAIVFQEASHGRVKVQNS